MRRTVTALAIAVPIALAALSLPVASAGPLPMAESRAKSGGTLRILGSLESLVMDPSAIYGGDDLAIAAAFTTRTLVTYPQSSSATPAVVVPDLATTTGTPSAGATVWSFTLRDGVTFEDGTPITCADVKYGVSRSFDARYVGSGPSFARDLLDIPRDPATRESTYLGPWNTSPANNRAAFNAAITCAPNKRTITFRLNQPRSDFRQIVTLPIFAPVQKSKDAGAEWDTAPQSTGPYRVASMTSTAITLARNLAWSTAIDPVRAAYPDSIVISLGLTLSSADDNPETIEARLRTDAGTDRAAVSLDALSGLTARSITNVLEAPVYGSRTIAGGTSSVRYLSINTASVTSLEARRAIAAGLDRQGILGSASKQWPIDGTTVAGTLADGLIPPVAGSTSPATELWTKQLGKAIPVEGNPAYACSLLRKAGIRSLRLTIDYPDYDGSLGKTIAGVVEQSLERCSRIKVAQKPIDWMAFYATIGDPTQRASMTPLGWVSDLPTASSVLEPLLSSTGSFNLTGQASSAVDDAITYAYETADPVQQAARWAALNKKAVGQAWYIPLYWERQVYLVGSKIRGAAISPATGRLTLGGIWIK